jgi:hypothetical protein
MNLPFFLIKLLTTELYLDVHHLSFRLVTTCPSFSSVWSNGSSHSCEGVGCCHFGLPGPRQVHCPVLDILGAPWGWWGETSPMPASVAVPAPAPAQVCKFQTLSCGPGQLLTHQTLLSSGWPPPGSWPPFGEGCGPHLHPCFHSCPTFFFFSCIAKACGFPWPILCGLHPFLRSPDTLCPWASWQTSSPIPISALSHHIPYPDGQRTVQYLPAPQRELCGPIGLHCCSKRLWSWNDGKNSESLYSLGGWGTKACMSIAKWDIFKNWK